MQQTENPAGRALIWLTWTDRRPDGSGAPPMIPPWLMWPKTFPFVPEASAAPAGAGRWIPRSAWRLSASSFPDCLVDGLWP